MDSTQGAGSDPCSAQALAEVPPLSQDLLFHFPPAPSAACPVPRSQRWFISPFLAPGFALNLQPGRLCCSVFFFKKAILDFFALNLSKATQSMFDYPPIQTRPPHYHAATVTKTAVCCPCSCVTSLHPLN